MSDVVTDTKEFKSEESIPTSISGTGHLLALSDRNIEALFEEYAKITVPHNIITMYGLGNKHFMILEIKGFIKKRSKK